MAEDTLSPADPPTVVHGLQSLWAAAFNRQDWAALCGLYHPQAQLFGGRPELRQGSNNIRGYFDTLPPGAHAAWKPGGSIEQVSEACIVYAGIIDFRRDGRERLHRMSWTLVVTTEGWQIASHHASPFTP